MRLILLQDDAKRIAATPEDMTALDDHKEQEGRYLRSSYTPHPTLQVPLLDLRGVENIGADAVADAVRSVLLVRRYGLPEQDQPPPPAPPTTDSPPNAWVKCDACGQRRPV